MVELREMEVSDYDAVTELWVQTEGISLRDADSRLSVERYLLRNPNLSFVAVKGDDIIGAVLVGSDGRRGYLQHLAVSSAFRGNHLGSRLVQEAVDALSKMGIPKTHLFVHNENINAQQFYEKLGWFLRDDLHMYSYNSSGNSNV